MELGSFNRRLVKLPPGEARAYEKSDWDDALVVVACGSVELEDLQGKRWRFEKGAVMWLTDLPLRFLHNPSESAAILMAISRR